MVQTYKNNFEIADFGVLRLGMQPGFRFDGFTQR